MYISLNRGLKLCSILSFTIFLSISSISAEQNERVFPYELGRKDLLITSLSYGLKLGADKYINYRSYALTVDEISSLKRSDINGIDRAATYNWSPNMDKLSDVFYKAFPIIAPAMALPSALKLKWKDSFTILTMYAEVFFITDALTHFAKGASTRIRPYAYNSDLTAEQRYSIQNPDSPGGTRSFFSGHTSTVFSSAVFISKVFQDIYGTSVWSRLIWGTTISAASLTAYARVKAGRHFFSDVFVGAVVGSAVGYLIPQTHKIKNKDFDLAIGPNAIQVSYAF